MKNEKIYIHDINQKNLSFSSSFNTDIKYVLILIEVNQYYLFSSRQKYILLTDRKHKDKLV